MKTSKVIFVKHDMPRIKGHLMGKYKILPEHIKGDITKRRGRP
jgi:hypothetical protein